MKNQCDGCRARMPLKNGIHYAVTAKAKYVAHMCCTAHLYKPSLPTPKSLKE